MSSELSPHDASFKEAMASLEQFVVNNDDLLELESRIGKFNIFDALGIARAEIKHSNFLAFILDPAESHGQGQLFLKAILMDLLKKAPADMRPLSPIHLDGIDLRGVEVRREWQNIDVLITCKEPRFEVVIENKVDSQDHSKQLDRYAETMKKHFSGQAPLYVYLTPDGDDPSEETTETWMPYTYADIHRVLRRVRETYLNAIGDEVLVFLEHYLNLLGTRFMNDERLIALCRRIYKNHRQALDLIWDHVGSPSSIVIEAVESELLENKDRWQVLQRGSFWITFMLTDWADVVQKLKRKAEDDPLHCSIFVGGSALYLIVEVGQMDDQPKRLEILQNLIANTSRFGFKQRKNTKLTGRITRVFGQETIADWTEDGGIESNALRIAVKKKLDDVLPKILGIPAILQPLCYTTDASQ